MTIEAVRNKNISADGAGDVSPEISAKWKQALSVASGTDNQSEDQKKAAEAGIAWERPENDKRSAKEIIDDTPLLKRLGNQSGVKDMLRERVGDFEKDADAAYRAVQVLNHVEKFDEEGNRIVGKDVGNGKVNGFTSSGDARHGTEAGRLQDFGKYGYEHLKGDLGNVTPEGDPAPSPADDKKARDQAGKMGIEWERPEDDSRSARDIIDDTPLLKQLGNQSGVKDMLRERVGDFEKDADAAYRAAQVLDRIVNYDENGKMLNGKDVDNDRIDGFTSSSEARHGTEAGRLQDFGKQGFSFFKEESSRYKDFEKNNPDADGATKNIYKYADFLEQNYDAIKEKTGADKYLSAEDLKNFRKDTPGISDEFKDALDFWSQDGMFEQLDNAQYPLRQDADGRIGTKDIRAWLDKTPKDTASTLDLLNNAAVTRATSDVDTSKLDKDVFENPDKYSAKEKAAVLNELLDAKRLITDGAQGGMWQDDKSSVTIANAVRGHPDPQKLLADVNNHIAILQEDPEVTKQLDDSRSDAMKEFLKSNEGLAEDLQKAYDDKYKSGEALDDLWKAGAEDKKTGQQDILSEYVGTAQSLQEVLGIDKPEDIQKAVQESSHYDEIENFYEESLISGDRYKELLKDNDFEAATSSFTAEVGLYGSVLDKDIVNSGEDKLNENFTAIAKDNILKDTSFDDLKDVFGKDGGKELDVEKVEDVLKQIETENPHLLQGTNGTRTKPEDIITALRGGWDMMRNGTKLGDLYNKLDSDPNLKESYKAGALHGVSGLLLAGATIARGAATGGKPTDKQIVDITAGSIQTASIMAEGGVKNYIAGLQGKDPNEIVSLEDMLKEDPKLVDKMKKVEKGLVGTGNLAGIAAGAYGIFDGVKALRNGDKLTAGLSISSGAMGVLAGVAGAVEGGMGVFASSVPRIIASLAGGLGLGAAAVAGVVALIPSIINEIKQENRVGDFADILSDRLKKYEIDGVPFGDYWDIPDSDWPETSDGLS